MLLKNIFKPTKRKIILGLAIAPILLVVGIPLRIFITNMAVWAILFGILNLGFLATQLLIVFVYGIKDSGLFMIMVVPLIGQFLWGYFIASLYLYIKNRKNPEILYENQP